MGTKPREIKKSLRVKDFLTTNILTATTATVTNLTNNGPIITSATSNAATSGAVAIPLTKGYQGYTTNDTAAIAATLADGTEGQVITIKLETKDTNNMVVTPANLHDGATLTFDASNEVATLIFVGTSWKIISSTATLA